MRSRRKPIAPAADLPQKNDTWRVLVQRLRTWIASPDERPVRPFVVLVLNLDTGIMQKSEIVTEPPTPPQLLAMLTEAMQKPPKGVGQKPHRPQQVQIEDEGLAEAVAAELAQLGVEVQFTPSRLPGTDQLIQDLETHLRGGPEPAGMLSGRGVTPNLAAGLFAAAAEFYRAAPWITLTDEDFLAVRLPPQRKFRYVSVMGHAGMTYGLAVYRRWEDVERMFAVADHPLEFVPKEGAQSLTFDTITQIPFDDVDAVEQYGWEIADEQAYPFVATYRPSGEVKRPDRDELLWYQAVLRAIPIFVKQYLKPARPGEYQPVEMTVLVATTAGEIGIELKYPAGKLPKETRPVEGPDWSEETEMPMPSLMRGGMESFMRMFSGGSGDSALDRAQELMYQAWEEANPARRIILAHEALKVSPLCADAYVLLAEEEADTLGRALEYYQQGVQAGEKALSPDYFKQNAGHFWGLIETRPYMRAREGLARTLWSLGREQEAIEHYREMLQLNPGDNQGIRYSLLDLLLTLNQDEAAWNLLQEYEDEGSAAWLYTRALLLFRQEGTSAAADQALAEARQQNTHIPVYLAGRRRIPTHLPPYMTWGGEDEAQHYAASHLTHWRQTPGAVAWLQQQTGPAASPSKSKTR